MDPKFQPPIPKFRRPRIFAHVVSALTLGLGFAVADRINRLIMISIHPSEDLAEITDKIQRAKSAAGAHKTKEVGSEQQVKFQRDEFLSKIQKKAAETKDPVDTKMLILKEIERRRDYELNQRFLMNFLYGLVIAKLGSEINLKIIYRRVPGLIPRLLITTPASVLSYYAFCNFYEGKDANELINRLRGDLLALLAFRIMIEYPANALLRRESKGKAISEETVRSKLARNKSVSVGLWIFLLTHLYQYSPLSSRFAQSVY